MKRLFLILMSVLLCSISKSEDTPHRNGLRFTEYSFPLKGDVEQIKIIDFAINPDNGTEYPRDTTLIKFNRNGDVTYIYPYVDFNDDVVWPTELYFLYNDLGYNTRIREIEYGLSGLTIECETRFTYNDSWQKIKGERYNEDGKILHTEKYVYDSHGCLTTKIYISGNECAVYTYDNKMNVVEIEEYYEERLKSKTLRTYNIEGKIKQEAVYYLNRLLDKMEKNRTTTYFYDENGFLFSEEMKSPIPEVFLKYSKDSRTETTESWTYKCDAYGNVIEKISYVTDTSCPRYRTEYRISYR